MSPPYVPPFPPRPPRALPPLQLLRAGRANLIAIWPESSFRDEIIDYRLLRRQIVVANSPATVKEAFLDNAAIFERKTTQQRNALAPLLGDGLFVSDGETWRQRRRVVAPVTHISRLAELAPNITEGAGERLAAWRARRPGSEVDVLAEMAEMTAGIICSTIFGRALGHGAARTVVSAFTDYQHLIDQVGVLSLLGLPDVLANLPGRRVRRSAARIHTVLDELIAEVLERRSSEASLLRAMADTPLAGSGVPMDRRAFRNEAAVLFMAGHETTAATLAWAWFILSQDAASEARLHAEIETVLGGRAPDYDDFVKLPFARAVIEETLRLYPPVPVQARQATAPGEVGGHKVERGAIVMLNAWLLHRHKLLWSDPDAFVPDRFMPGGEGAPSRYAFVPFSIGPRVCTGMAFGLAEAVLCLATLAQSFRLRLRPGWQVMPVCKLSLRPQGGLPMLLERRI
jgi:cytochrome P450